MARTASILVHVEPEVKEEADAILNQLGITMSGAINLYLKQIVQCKGIPFDLKLPENPLPNFFDMTPEEQKTYIQQGLDDIKNGKTVSLEELKNVFEEDFGYSMPTKRAPF